jgi:murein DD-endopeptidase MepM/ murein hydrolase activator NlpD
MIAARPLGLLLALMPLAAGLAGCVRTAPPAPVVAPAQASGTSAAPPSVAPMVYATPLPAAPAAAAPVIVQSSLAQPSAAPLPVPAASQAVARHPDSVIVQPHETLYAISRRYDVPVRSLIEANAIAPPYALAAGRRLVIPQVRQHAVQPGETLYSVSRLYGVDVNTLARANGMAPPFTVIIGQVLVLPASVGSAESATLAAPLAPATIAPVAVTRTALPPPEARAGESEPPEPARIEPALNPLRTELAALPPPSTVPRSGHGFVWPVKGRLIAAYGTSDSGTHNDGINIAAPLGTTVVAADDGVVAYAGNELRGYGNLVLLKHRNGWMTAYAHNSALLVKRGQKVRRGQAIARVGTTGAVSRPQLHFEIRRGTRALDPADYLPAITATANG